MPMPIIRFWTMMLESALAGDWKSFWLAVGVVFAVVAVTGAVTCVWYNERTRMAQIVLFGLLVFLWLLWELLGVLLGPVWAYSYGGSLCGVFLMLAAGMALGWLIVYLRRHRKTNNGDV